MSEPSLYELAERVLARNRSRNTDATSVLQHCCIGRPLEEGQCNTVEPVKTGKTAELLHVASPSVRNTQHFRESVQQPMQHKVIPFDRCPDCRKRVSWTWDRCPSCGHNRHVSCMGCLHWTNVCEMGRNPSHPELRVTICGLYRENK